MTKAKLVKEITVVDPDTKGEVQLTVYKHENGGLFAIDSSYLDQNFDDDKYPVIPDPFDAGNKKVMLVEENTLTNFIEKADMPQN